MSVLRLEAEGYTVIEASTATHGLYVLSQEPSVWLVTSGLLMSSGMNGLQLAREIRHRYQTQKKLLLITGYTEEAIPALAYLAGYDAVAFKPVVVLELKEMLEMLRRQEE